MDPLTIAGLLTGGVSALANIIGGNQQGQLTRDQLDQQRREFGVGATQLNPFAQQQARQRQAILGQLVNRIQPSAYSGGQFTGGLRDLPAMLKGASSFFGPEAMAGAEDAFHRTVQTASPTYRPPSRTDIGYASGVGPHAAPAEQLGEGGRFFKTPFYERLSPETQQRLLSARKQAGYNAF